MRPIDRIGAEKFAQALALMAQGASRKEAAAAVGMHYDTLNHRVSRAGMSKPFMDKAEAERIAAMVRDLGMAETCRRVGRSDKGLRLAFARLGVVVEIPGAHRRLILSRARRRLGVERLREIGAKAFAKLTPEQRAENGRKGMAAARLVMTHEQWVAAGRKGGRTSAMRHAREGRGRDDRFAAAWERAVRAHVKAGLDREAAEHRATIEMSRRLSA